MVLGRGMNSKKGDLDDRPSRLMRELAVRLALGGGEFPLNEDVCSRLVRICNRCGSAQDGHIVRSNHLFRGRSAVQVPTGTSQSWQDIEDALGD